MIRNIYARLIGGILPLIFAPLQAGIVTTLSDAPGTPGSLREVIAASVSGEEITFADSISGGMIVLEQGDIAIEHALDIVGPGDGLVINANGESRIFTIGIWSQPNVDVSIEGISFMGGKAEYGGAIDCATAVLSLKRCAFFFNQATKEQGSTTPDSAINGGAIRMEIYSNLRAEKCHFIWNRALNEGGAVVCSHGCGTECGPSFSAAFTDCQFYGNRARVGGAVNFDGTQRLWVFRCNFRYNTAERRGGALTVNGSNSGPTFPQSFTITHSSFRGNRATGGIDSLVQGAGGAIYVSGIGQEYAFISTSTFTQNGARSGSAIALYMVNTNEVEGLTSGPAFIYDCTVVKNYSLPKGSDASAIRMQTTTVEALWDGTWNQFHFWNNAVSDNGNGPDLEFRDYGCHFVSHDHNSFGSMEISDPIFIGPFLQNDLVDVTFQNTLTAGHTLDLLTLLDYHRPINTSLPASLGELVDQGNTLASTLPFWAPEIPLDLANPFPPHAELGSAIQAYDQIMNLRYNVPFNPIPMGYPIRKDRGAIELQAKKKTEFPVKEVSRSKAEAPITPVR